MILIVHASTILGEPYTFNHPIKALSITPDGRHLYAATHENLVQHRYLNTQDAAERICTIAHPRISTTDWQHHFPNLPYQPPC